MNSIPPNELPDYDFNGLTYQPKNKNISAKKQLKKELDKILDKAKKSTTLSNRLVGLGVLHNELFIENDSSTPTDFYKKAWSKALASLPEWRQKEINFLYKTGDTENRHYIDFVRLVAFIAEQ